MLSFDEFCLRVAERFGATTSELQSQSFEALGWDSLQLTELDLLVEQLGVRVSEADLASAQGLADIYAAYKGGAK